MSQLPKLIKIINANSEIIDINDNELLYLQLLAELKTTKQIATLTQIPLRTVEYHLQSLKKKLAIKSKKQLFEIIKNNHLKYLLGET